MTITKHAWIGRENLITVLVNERDPRTCELVPVDFTSIQSADLYLGDYMTTVTQATPLPPVNWWDGRLNTGEVVFELGHWAESDSIPADTYLLKLVVYDVPGPEGTVVISPAKKDMRVILNG